MKKYYNKIFLIIFTMQMTAAFARVESGNQKDFIKTPELAWKHFSQVGDLSEWIFFN